MKLKEITLVALIGISVWVIFFWRYHVSTNTTNKLCVVLKTNQSTTLREAETPGTDSYRLARILYPDPVTRKRVLGEFKAQLESLPC